MVEQALSRPEVNLGEAHSQVMQWFDDAVELYYQNTGLFDREAYRVRTILSGDYFVTKFSYQLMIESGSAWCKYGDIRLPISSIYEALFHSLSGITKDCTKLIFGEKVDSVFLNGFTKEKAEQLINDVLITAEIVRCGIDRQPLPDDITLPVCQAA